MPRAQNEYIVFTGVPQGPVFRGHALCAPGPSLPFTKWWKAYGKEVQEYERESRFSLTAFNAGMERAMNWRELDFENTLFHNVRHLVQFDQNNTEKAKILDMSVDNVTTEETRNLKLAIQTSDDAKRARLLINNVLDKVNEKYNTDVAGCANETPQQLVQNLLLKITKFLQ
jgi:hypothetical protein